MISVIIPLYNKESTIGRTLESVLRQTYSNFEIIVVDDGSTDGSAKVAIAHKENKVHYVYKTNGGVSSARNLGVHLAKGEYIAFLDADDEWDAQYLEELIHLINDYSDAGIWGFSNIIVNGNMVIPDYHGFPEGYRDEIDNTWTSNVPYWTSATCIARSVFEKVGLFDERISYGEDLDMWWRVLLEFKGAYCAKPLVKYRQDAENRAMNMFIPFEKHLPFYIEKYSSHRAADKDFRFFFDRECLYRIFQYTGMRQYKDDLKRVLSQIDFSLQKKSMRLRFMFPALYRIYLKIRGRS